MPGCAEYPVYVNSQPRPVCWPQSLFSLVTEIAPNPGDQYSVQGPGGTRSLPLVHLSPPLGYLRWEVLCEPLALSASRGSLLYFAAYVPPSQPLPFICVLQSGRQSRPQLGLPLLTPVVTASFTRLACSVSWGYVSSSESGPSHIPTLQGLNEEPCVSA